MYRGCSLSRAPVNAVPHSALHAAYTSSPPGSHRPLSPEPLPVPDSLCIPLTTLGPDRALRPVYPVPFPAESHFLFKTQPLRMGWPDSPASLRSSPFPPPCALLLVGLPPPAELSKGAELGRAREWPLQRDFHGGLAPGEGSLAERPQAGSEGPLPASPPTSGDSRLVGGPGPALVWPPHVPCPSAEAGLGAGDHRAGAHRAHGRGPAALTGTPRSRPLPLLPLQAHP